MSAYLARRLSRLLLRHGPDWLYWAWVRWAWQRNAPKGRR